MEKKLSQKKQNLFQKKWIAIQDGVLFAMAGKKDPESKIVSYRYVQGHTSLGKNPHNSDFCLKRGNK